MARVFCDSSTKKACIVVEGQEPIFIVYPSPVTNNVGEYTAVLLALEAAQKLRLEDVDILTDSQLVVEQVNGRWKVRTPHLLSFNRLAKEVLKKGGARLSWIPREENLAGIELERLEGVDN